MASSPEPGFLQVFPDGRVEGGLFPPEYYVYPADLFGGSWEDGLKAVEEFGWGPESLAAPGEGDQNTALKQSQPASGAIVEQIARTETRDRALEIIKLSSEGVPPTEKVCSAIEMADVVETPYAHAGVTNVPDSKMEVDTLKQTKAGSIKDRMEVPKPSQTDLFAPQPAIGPMTLYSPSRISGQPKQTIGAQISDQAMKEETIAHPDERARPRQGSDELYQAPATTTVLDHAGMETLPTGQAWRKDTPGESPHPRSIHESSVHSPDVMEVDDAGELAPADGEERLVSDMPVSIDAEAMPTESSREASGSVALADDVEPRILLPEPTISEPPAGSEPLVQFNPVIWHKTAGTSNEHESMEDPTSSVKVGPLFGKSGTLNSFLFPDTNVETMKAHQDRLVAYSDTSESRRSSIQGDLGTSDDDPAGSRTSPYTHEGPLVCLPLQTEATARYPIDDFEAPIEGNTVLVDELGTRGPILNHPQDTVPQSTGVADSIVPAKSEPNTWLQGLEEATAAANVTTSGTNHLLTSPTPGLTDAVSAVSPWSEAQIQKELLDHTPDLPPSPYDAEFLASPSSILDATANQEPSVDSMANPHGELSSGAHGRMAGLSLENPIAPAQGAAPESTPPASVTLPVQAPASGPAKIPDPPVAPSTDDSATAAAEAKKAADLKEARSAAAKLGWARRRSEVASLKPEGASEPEERTPRKRRKTTSAGKGKTPKGSKGNTATTNDSPATTKVEAVDSNKAAARKANEPEKKPESKAAQDDLAQDTDENKSEPSERAPTVPIPPSYRLLTSPLKAKPAPPTTPTHTPQTTGSIAADRHPLDLGYGKRHTRADTNHAFSTSTGNSANPDDVEGEVDLDDSAALLEETHGDVEEEVEAPKAKKTAPAASKRKRKKASPGPASSDEDSYQPNDHTRTRPKTVSGAKKAKTAASTPSATAKPKPVRKSLPRTRASTPKPTTTATASEMGTPGSTNSTPNKYGFKPPSGPRKPRAEKGKGKGKAKTKTKKVSDEIAGLDGVEDAEPVTTTRQTRRKSATNAAAEVDAEAAPTATRQTRRKSAANAAAEAEAEPATTGKQSCCTSEQLEPVATTRQTRRTSAAQEQLEREAEKEKNIGLRLRSGSVKP